MGVGPNSFNAAICDALPYPLFPAKSYPGNTESYSTIKRSLVTLVIILAAPMDKLFASPLIIGTCFISTPGMVTASFSNISGFTGL